MQTFIHGYFKDLGGAPAVVVVLTANHAQEPYMQASYQSSAAAMYNLLLLAHEGGLGTCWMTGQTIDYNGLYSLFLSDNESIY